MRNIQINLSELMAPAFADVHADQKHRQHRHYWLSGGRGSGKSSFVSLEIAISLALDKTASALVLRKVGDKLYDSVVKQMLWALDAIHALGDWQLYQRPYWLANKRTGQEILFRGLDDPEKIKGIKPGLGQRFRHVWFEELKEFAGMDEIQSVLASVGRGTDEFTAWYSYNPPKSAGNWVNAEALADRPDRYVHDSNYLDMPREWLGSMFFEEAEQIRRTSERTYNNVYLGKVTGTGGAVFDNIELREITAAERGSFDKILYGLDFGFAVDPDAMVAVYYDQRASILYILDEIYSNGQSQEILAARATKLAGKSIITCDNEDPRMISALKQRGVSAYPAKKGPGSIEHGIRWLSERGKIVIDKRRCPNAAREFMGLEYAQDRYGNFMAKVKAGNDHTVDATRYAVEELSNARTIKIINKAFIGL
ncbi:terminase large subunit [Clostridia bacterium]|nr:terminase large subunit [Clostridia bacterium]